MAVVVVGGHTRNIGKTTLVEAVLRSTPDLSWTAMKLTQFGHNVCSAHGGTCGCDTGMHPMAVSQELRVDTGSDTARMLAAGAAKVLWVRTRQGELVHAIPRIRHEIASSQNVLLESNSILRFLKPDLYLAVLDTTNPDFKSSALHYLDRADALFTVDGSLSSDYAWKGVSATLIRRKPVYALREAELPNQLARAIYAVARGGLNNGDTPEQQGSVGLIRCRVHIGDVGSGALDGDV